MSPTVGRSGPALTLNTKYPDTSNLDAVRGWHWSVVVQGEGTNRIQWDDQPTVLRLAIGRMT